MKNLHRSVRRRWLWATAIAAIIAIVACNKNDDKQAAQLAISSFSPAEAAEGATVVIKGTAFSPDKTLNTVKFNGLAAAVSNAAANGTELSVTVPEEATTGKITVTVGDQTVTTATEFKVNATAPVITAVAPLKGDIGTEVTITGNRFTNTSEVYFGGIKATEVTFVGKTSLKAKLPAGALNGKVKVTAASLEALSAADFWVKPTITGFTTKAKEDAIIDIEGANFSTVSTENAVFFGTVPAAEITEATPNKLKVKVPGSITSALIRVVVKEQEAQSSSNFMQLPTLISFSSEKIERGQKLTISGKNFFGADVFLNGKFIPTSANSATSLEIQIPGDAESGKLLVKQFGAEQEFAKELRVVNYWKWHSLVTPPLKYSQSRQFVYNNKIYYGFGQNNTSGGYTSEVHSFDPINKTWKHEFDIPSKVRVRRLHFSTVKGNKWYFGNGDDGISRPLDFWVMDLSQTGDQAFTQLTAPQRESAYDRAFVLNDIIYLAAQETEKKIYQFDPATNSGKGSWNPVVATNLSGAVASGVVVLNGKAYIFDNARNFVLFDPAGPTLITKAKLPSLQYTDTDLFAVNGKCYFIAYETMYEYDPGEDKWTTRSGTPAGALEVHVVNNRVFGMATNGNTYEYIYE